MRRLRFAVIPLSAFLSLLWPVHGQGIITTVAGGGPNNMPALAANLSQPTGVAVDAAGNMYVVTAHGNRVFKVNSSGQLTIFAGVGNGDRHWQNPGDADFGGDGGPAPIAYLYGPNQVAVDNGGNVFIADSWNHRIRRVDITTGIISTVAGNGFWSFGGDGGQATAASLALPMAIALDNAGNLFIADRSNNRIRRVDADSGVISTMAGSGSPGYGGDGGPATNAALYNPFGVAVDTAGNIFIADTYNHRIRKVDAATGIITTVAGNGLGTFSGDGGPAVTASIYRPYDVAVDTEGNLVIADTSNARVRRVDATRGTISTIAGTGFAVFNGDGGPAVNANLNMPAAVEFDHTGNILIVDSGQHRVRRIDAATGTISTVAGNGTWGFSGDNQIAIEASLFYPWSLAHDIAGNLYIADWGNYAIRRLDALTGFMTTVAGNGTLGIPQDGAPATSAIFYPEGVAVDAARNIYLSQPLLHRIIRVDGLLGTISTIAGYNSATNIVSGFSGDGGPAANALLNSPTGLTLDADGNLFFSDSGNFRIRRIDTATGIITTVVGNGINGYSGDGGPATGASIAAPRQLVFDLQGNLFFADISNRRVRRVDALTGVITTVAGNGTNGPLEEGVLATSTSLVPNGLALDAGGNLFVTEGPRIRRIDADSGMIHTIAGGPLSDFSGDGGSPINALFNDPLGLLVDASHRLFVCDRVNNRVRAFPLPNTAPAANAGADLTIEATGATTPVVLNGSASSDPDGDALSYEWRDEFVALIGTSASVNANVSLGAHQFTLQVTDPSGASSNDTVLVTVRDTTPPAVAVTAPNGGEKLFAGSSYTIQWSASDAVALSSFDVEFSSNGGVSFSPLPGCFGLSGAARSCDWTSVGPATTQGRIRVTAMDSSGNAAADISNANYSVVSGTPSITVTQPNTAVNWNVGTTQQIKWSHNLGLNSYVRVELSRDAGATWELIAASIKNNSSTSGAYPWVVTAPTTSQALIRVTWTAGPASDVSNVNFNIPSPFITGVSPSSSVNWGYGTLRTVTWSTNLGAAERVNVRLSTDGGATFPTVLASGVVASNKKATFSSPTLASPTTLARIRVEWVATPGVLGTNPANFKIQPPFLTVTNPNLASHVWLIGSAKTITWSQNLGNLEKVLIELSLDGGASYPIVLFASTPSDGGQPVTVQSAWATPQARVRITWIRNAAVTDVSNQSFPIQ